MITPQALLSSDCQVLFSRALQDQRVTCFGGKPGKFGGKTVPVSFTISSVEVHADLDNDHDWPVGIMELKLEGFSTEIFGDHVVLDPEFCASFSSLLKASFIDPTAVKLAPASRQRDGSVILEVNVQKVLDW